MWPTLTNYGGKNCKKRASNFLYLGGFWKKERKGGKLIGKKAPKLHYIGCCFAKKNEKNPDRSYLLVSLDNSVLVYKAKGKTQLIEMDFFIHCLFVSLIMGRGISLFSFYYSWWGWGTTLFSFSILLSTMKGAVF